MCLIAWNWQPTSQTPLLLLANRDEFYQRNTLPVHWWDGGLVLAGKDLRAGGTWLGISRSGKLAALTNYRSATPAREDAFSRGGLVTDFLNSDIGAAQFLQNLRRCTQDYNPFNLLVYDGVQLLGLESRTTQVLEMPSGIGAVSNADFQTPWPKVLRLKQGLQHCLERNTTQNKDLFALLHDRNLADDTWLPHTGVPLDLERLLSAAFITSAEYGTRACSVVRLHQNHAEFSEQSHGATGFLHQQHHHFAL